MGQIDHNLQNRVFDDVICKPPIESHGDQIDFQKMHDDISKRTTEFRDKSSVFYTMEKIYLELSILGKT